MLVNSVSRVLVPTARNLVQKRSQSVISGPPTVKVSKAEIKILGSVMIGSLLVIPAWVLVHLKEYRGQA